MKNQETKKPGSEKKDKTDSQEQIEKNEKKNKQTAQTAQPTTASTDKKIDDQVTGKTHQGNNDSAPVHPGSEHKIAAWVEAQPNKQNE